MRFACNLNGYLAVRHDLFNMQKPAELPVPRVFLRPNGLFKVHPAAQSRPSDFVCPINRQQIVWHLFHLHEALSYCFQLLLT